MQKKWSNIINWKTYSPDIFWPILAVLVTVIVFIPSINYQFLLQWDDGYYIGNQHLEITLANIRYWLTGFVQGLYTPVTSYSFMIDHCLFGDNPTGYHLHNILLHCGSILFLIAIMKQLRISPAIAAVVALLWAIHPQRVPSVVWITERKDVLVVFFALASFYTYISACKKKQFSIVSPLFLLLSLGAKPAAMGLPVVMLIYTLWHYRKWREVRLLIPSFVTLILYLSWFYYIQSTKSGITTGTDFLQKAWVVSHNIMWYLCSGFVPFQLNPMYPGVTPPGIDYLPLICGFILLGCIVCTALFMTGRLSLKLKIWLLISMALCWGALFFPVSGIFSIGAVDYCDRYNYLPSIVTWIMLAMFVNRQTQQKWIKHNKFRKFMPLAFLLVLYFYWFSNWSYMPAWNNCENLFVRTVECQYANPRAIDNLGAVAIISNNPQLLELASKKYLTLFAAGNKMPCYPKQRNRDLWLQAGLFLGAYAQFIRGNPAEAFPIFIKLQKMAQHKVLQFYNKNGYVQKFWGSLASCYLNVKQPEEALRCLKNQLRVLKPDSSDALFNKGLTAFIRKDFVAAEKYWKAANKLNPEDKKIIYNINAVKKLQIRENSKIQKK